MQHRRPYPRSVCSDLHLACMTSLFLEPPTSLSSLNLLWGPPFLHQPLKFRVHREDPSSLYTVSCTNSPLLGFPPLLYARFQTCISTSGLPPDL